MTLRILTRTTLAAALLSTAAVPALADGYAKTRNACTSAIAGQLGELRSYNINKVKSRARHKDYQFIVRTADNQRVIASCRARNNGDVVALTIDGNRQQLAKGH